MSEIKKISKDQEIEHLVELLNSSSYLRDSVGDEGISDMIQNIKNDLPIELGVFIETGDHKEIVENLKVMLAKKDCEIADMKDARVQELRMISQGQKITEKLNSQFRAEVLEEILSDEYIKKCKYSRELVGKRYSPIEIVVSKIKQGIPINDNLAEVQIVEAAMVLLTQQRSQKEEK